jgi:hypothetical protein
MSNPWKIATIGILALMGTGLTTGLTTAFLMRPSAAGGEPVAATPARAAMSDAYRPAPARTAAVAPVRRVASRAATPTASTTPVDCATGTDRAWRIAKPGLVGTLLGAGLGAAGGAIADGRDGAGKGALIGGLAGAAAGAGYGTYKTRNECGTIFGSTDGVSTVSVAR